MITSKHKTKYELSHTDGVFRVERVAKLIPAAVRELKRLMAGVNTDGEPTLQFDAIAFRGMSGCLFAAPLAYRLRKPMIMIRKKCENCGRPQSHTSMTVEGDRNAKTYIIVDDFVSSGYTVRVIKEEISSWSQAKCVGVMTARAVVDAPKGTYKLSSA